MLFSLPFTNEYTHGEKFYITIEGLEKGSTELSVVSNPAQWEFYCSTRIATQRIKATTHLPGFPWWIKQAALCICWRTRA